MIKGKTGFNFNIYDLQLRGVYLKSVPWHIIYFLYRITVYLVILVKAVTRIYHLAMTHKIRIPRMQIFWGYI